MGAHGLARIILGSGADRRLVPKRTVGDVMNREGRRR